MSNTGSSAGNTKPYFSSVFLCQVRRYRGYSLVPYKVLGNSHQQWAVWSGDERTQLAASFWSLTDAKLFVDKIGGTP